MNANVLTINKMHTAIMENQWGNKISQGDNFYKLIFKLEKQGKESSISNEEMYLLFESYKIWFKKTNELLGACNSESDADTEARVYGERFKTDIMEHVHSIIMESSAETPDWSTKLVVTADMVELAKKNAMQT